MEELDKIDDEILEILLTQTPFIHGERNIDAPYQELEDGTKVFVVDAQQTARIEQGEFAVYRSVSGCTILELDYGDHYEVFHILAGTFSLIKNYPEDSDADYSDRIFARKIRKLGDAVGVKKIRYYINQIHTGMDERRRYRIFELNAGALQNISSNCEIFEIRNDNDSQTDDMFESVDILTDGNRARVLQRGYKIVKL